MSGENFDKTFYSHNVPTTIARRKSRGFKSMSEHYQDNIIDKLTLYYCIGRSQTVEY